MQEKELNQYRQKMLSFLREKLKNSSVDMSLKMTEAEDIYRHAQSPD